MRKKHWYKEKQEEFEHYERYVSVLEQRYNEALEEIKNISVGFVLPDDVGTSWSHGLRLQNRAATFLRNVCRQPKDRKPSFYL